MVAGGSLGELEQLVLLALIRLGEEAYGVTVRREIERRARRAVTLGSVYSTLMRLEGKGLVDSRVGDPTPERGGRRKRHYVVLPLGRRALAQTLGSLRRMARGLDAALELP
jgi:PadR family transcriptional regulator PadR